MRFFINVGAISVIFLLIFRSHVQRSRSNQSFEPTMLSAQYLLTPSLYQYQTKLHGWDFISCDYLPVSTFSEYYSAETDWKWWWHAHLRKISKFKKKHLEWRFTWGINVWWHSLGENSNFLKNLKVGGTRIGPIIMKGLTSKFLFPYSCTYQTFVIDETIWKWF